MPDSYRKYPILSILGVPAEQRDACSAIHLGLVSLGSYIDSFRAALDLLDFSIVEKQYKFSRIAFQAGALEIYRVRYCIEIISSRSLPACPAVGAWVDHDQKRRAMRLFDAHFPDWDGIRHAIAHVEEFIADPRKLSMHSITGPRDEPKLVKMEGASTVFINGAVSGRKYTMSFENRLISYELSRASAEHLANYVIEFYRAFKRAAQETFLAGNPTAASIHQSYKMPPFDE